MEGGESEHEWMCEWERMRGHLFPNANGNSK